MMERDMTNPHPNALPNCASQIHDPNGTNNATCLTDSSTPLKSASDGRLFKPIKPSSLNSRTLPDDAGLPVWAQLTVVDEQVPQSSGVSFPVAPINTVACSSKEASCTGKKAFSAPSSTTVDRSTSPVAALLTDRDAADAISSAPTTTSPTSGANERLASAVGAQSTTSSSSSTCTDICRICHCEATPEAALITPCYCSGTLKYVHQRCLQMWIKSSQTRACEVCRFNFIMHTKLKPFRKWEKLDMSSVERRKILCSVAFHVVAITCVMWSLYVLIDRTAEEVRDNSLEWPFWTKLVVVAVGFTGGVVFMYVQCKMYVQLFARWRAYNKVVFVQNGPAIHQAAASGDKKAAAGHGRADSK